MFALRAIRKIGKANCRLLHKDYLAGLPEHYRNKEPKDMVKFDAERFRLADEMGIMIAKIEEYEKLKPNSKGYKKKTDQLKKEIKELNAKVTKFEYDNLDATFYIS